MKIIEEFVESILREAYPLTYQFIYDQSTLLQYLDGKMKLCMEIVNHEEVWRISMLSILYCSFIKKIFAMLQMNTGSLTGMII